MTRSVYTLCGFQNLKPVGFCVVCEFCGNYTQRRYKQRRYKQKSYKQSYIRGQICEMGWYFAPLSRQSISPYIFIYQPLTAPSTLYCYIGRYKQKVFINYNIFHVVVATSVT